MLHASTSEQIDEEILRRLNWLYIYIIDINSACKKKWADTYEMMSIKSTSGSGFNVSEFYRDSVGWILALTDLIRNNKRNEIIKSEYEGMNYTYLEWRSIAKIIGYEAGPMISKFPIIKSPFKSSAWIHVSKRREDFT